MSKEWYKKTDDGFTILAVYVDILNLIGTLKELNKISNYLENEFKINKFFFKYCLDLQIEHVRPWWTVIHQSSYTEKC